MSDVLGPEDAAFFAAHYDVSAEGNFEGHNILNRLNAVPRSHGGRERLAACAQSCLQRARERVRPGPR